MSFYPPDALAPVELRTHEFLLRPLRTTDVALDYDAVISSAEMLRRWSLSDWPREGFIARENLADLLWHEREHEEGIAFTFTVMAPDDSECLGCVYVKPVLPSPYVSGVRLGNYPACVSFWVRQSRLQDCLDVRLLVTLRGWFAADWRFSRIIFRTSNHDTRQSRLFAKEGLLLRGEVESVEGCGKWLAFTEPTAPLSD